MKILQSNGNYTNGTKIIQLNDGRIQKLLMFTKNGNPSQEIIKEWESFEAYKEETKQKPYNIENVFKNW